MKDYNLEDARAGTACTFTGRGSHDKKGRLAHALIVSGFAALLVFAIGVAYFMAQTSSRPSLPISEGPAITSASMPGASAPSGPHSGPLFDSRSTLSPSPPAGRVETGEAPQVPSRSAGSSTRISPTGSSAILGSTPRFHVQSGSFMNRDNAVSLATRLRDHGYAVTLTAGQLYRVWVGGDLDRTKAERLAAKLRATGFDATLITR
jgi:cell division septation protein DedD